MGAYGSLQCDTGPGEYLMDHGYPLQHSWLVAFLPFLFMMLGYTHSGHGLIYAFLAMCMTVLYFIVRPRRRPPLPPGPKGWPILGNVFDMPKKRPWLTFSEWGKTYGDIMHINVLGRPIVIINSLKVAHDLLEKRSTVYSDRPKLEMASFVGYHNTIPMLPYGQEWRQQRKIMVQALNPTHCRLDYHQVQEKEAALLVLNLIQSSDRLASEIGLRVGAIIFRTAYGYSVKSEDDPMLATVLRMMHEFGLATKAGMFLVDVIPFLRYVPSWLPGAGFKRIAFTWRQTFEDSVWKPLLWTKHNLENGNALMPNVCADIYQASSGNIDETTEKQLAFALVAILGGALDTNISTALTFFMAMVLNPTIQKKAQAELDAVVGSGRLPTISDESNLPYIRSIIAEVYRWGPTAPLALPHAPAQDDEYNGMFIPKGCIILPNSWHMLHDPESYPDPMKFNPERYAGQDSEMAKVKSVAFGFGRRSCPGFHFAEATFFAIVSITLATCDILPHLDDNGDKILPKYSYTSGNVSFPAPFLLELRSRSPQAAELLAKACSGTIS